MFVFCDAGLVFDDVPDSKVHFRYVTQIVGQTLSSTERAPIDAFVLTHECCIHFTLLANGQRVFVSAVPMHDADVLGRV